MKSSTKWMLLGILSVIFGIYILGNAFVSSVTVAWVIGVLLLVSGAFQIVGGFISEVESIIYASINRDYNKSALSPIIDHSLVFGLRMRAAF
jgi:uncharacterized membrane protein HdeD (DUF308 family)